jgi:tetratricopeptide (TPR) repeat protein
MIMARETARIGLCPEDQLAEVVQRIGADEGNDTSELDVLLVSYPEDPRLHFLRGSLLAAGREYAAAVKAMRRAVEAAPDYAIARFQLGFLLLTSGEAHAAQEAWGPLHGLAAEHYLRRFVEGLTHLIHNRFDDAIDCLLDGIRRNEENPPMNGDMRLIVDEVRRKMADADSMAALSPAHLLLQQSALKSTKH